MNIYSRIFWLPCDVPGRLAMLSRPAAERLTAEIAAWRDAGVSVVVSLLEPDEQDELGLRRESELCAQAGIEFVSFPIADGGVPASRRDAGALTRRLAKAIAVSSVVGIHCRAGIGRSAIIAASILIALGNSAETALASITQARGVGVPDTREQRDWITADQTRTM